MRVRRSFRRFLILPASIAAVAASASTAVAQGRQLFDWSGRVDREVRISMRGRDARAHSVGQYDMQRSRLNVATALPQREGRVWVRVEDGRGDVDVVQQPSARNNYTTIVRIRDRSSGTDVYTSTPMGKTVAASFLDAYVKLVRQVQAMPFPQPVAPPAKAHKQAAR